MGIHVIVAMHLSYGNYVRRYDVWTHGRVRVIELGVWVAGPAAAGLLADWGADVIKIEPPSGDPARSFQRMLGGDMPNNPPFELDNRGKRSVVLDLSTPAGLEAALSLIESADVFITNLERVL